MRICVNCKLEKDDSEYSGPKIKFCESCRPEVTKNRREQYFARLKEDIKTGKRQYIPITEQSCITCKVTKPICEFAIQPRRVTGHSLECKKCKNEYNREYSKRTQDRNKARCKKFYEENREYVISETRKWALEHPEKRKEIMSKCCKKRRSTLMWNLSGKISSQIRMALNNNGSVKNGGKWRDVLGYTIEELKSSLESKFKDGMTWEKFLNGELHLEHETPVASFYFESEDDEDFKKCWSLNNLTLLWAKDNIIKGDKMSCGKRGRHIRNIKIKYLNEEFSVAGFEAKNIKESEEDLTG